MTDTKEKERTILTKNALEDLLRIHDIREFEDGVDEIVFSYLVTVLNELDSLDEFDFIAFEEMMKAYIPGFENIPSGEVFTWIVNLYEHHQNINKKKSLPKDEESQNIVKYLSATSKDNLIPEKADLNVASGGNDGLSTESDPVSQLMELFPTCSLIEAKHFFSIAKGQLDQAAQLMLLAQDSDNSDGFSLSKPCKIGKSTVKKDKEMQEVKESIIQQYGYVDVEEEEISHCPRAPKWEGKKMVRYREGQIVSKKGEKYQIEKDQREESDSMKNTYVNLKPGKKYRFH